MSDEKVILVVGACCLDRLLSVKNYPEADTKVRTTAYHEIGGGNAANTASAMALLKDAKVFSGSNLSVKLLTKLGDDYVGKQLSKELEEAGVDISSPLFQYGDRGSTTDFTTIIVSDSEVTRTCFHTPGTCGELTVEDLQKVDLDQVFENVIHLHSDSRFSDTALVLASEARRRGITVSVDAEKDRNIGSQHGLLELATTIFTNGGQMTDYFAARTKRLEEHHNRAPLPDMKIVCDNNAASKMLANSVRPSAFYLRWFGDSQLEKDVVITKGGMGAIHVKPTSFEKQKSASNVVVVNHPGNIVQEVTDGDVGTKTRYKVQSTGVLKEVDVVDSTGAGDAFIGGYLVAWSCGFLVQFSLTFGAWVGGKKLEGPGARSTLPHSVNVDEQLGTSAADVESSLLVLLDSFGEKVKQQQERLSP